jgi:hypothetical protein
LGLIPIPIGFAKVLTLVAPLRILSGASFLDVFTRSQLNALALGCLTFRGEVLLVETAFWGFCFFPFGLLVIRSGFFPKFLGVVLIIVGGAYLVGSFTSIVLPAYAHAVTQVTSKLEAGELVMMLWLLIVGTKLEHEPTRAA